MKNTMESQFNTRKTPENTGDKENVEVMEESGVKPEHIGSEEVEAIKNGDAKQLETQRKEMGKSLSFEEIAENNKENEKLLALAKEKIEEMQKSVDKAGASFFKPNKRELDVANLVLKQAREEVESGSVPNDMESLKRHVKFAQKVDVSEFPASKKKLVAGNAPGGDLAR